MKLQQKSCIYIYSLLQYFMPLKGSKKQTVFPNTRSDREIKFCCKFWHKLKVDLMYPCTLWIFLPKKPLFILKKYLFKTQTFNVQTQFSKNISPSTYFDAICNKLAWCHSLFTRHSLSFLLFRFSCLLKGSTHNRRYIVPHMEGVDL